MVVLFYLHLCASWQRTTKGVAMMHGYTKRAVYINCSSRWLLTSLTVSRADVTRDVDEIITFPSQRRNPLQFDGLVAPSLDAFARRCRYQPTPFTVALVVKATYEVIVRREVVDVDT